MGPSATYEVEEELFKTDGQMTFQIIALDFVYAMCCKSLL